MNRSLFVLVISILALNPVVSSGQSRISASFPENAHQQIQLFGFDGFGSYLIGSTKADAKGWFELAYNSVDVGMGFLVAEDQKPFIVILSGEEIQLKGEIISHPQTIEVLKSLENQLFDQYVSEHPRREQAMSAWDYLQRIYTLDPLFAAHQNPRMAIETERQRIREEDNAFLAGIDPKLYVSWFLPVRKLVSSVPTIAQYRTGEIPGAIAAFRDMDYTDPRLFKSGLLRETIEAHFWLIENSGRSLDSVYVEMNISIDHMISNLKADRKKFNEIARHLFNLLEERSLFGSSEYLALKLLGEHHPMLDESFARRLEAYRSMKTGGKAPDIIFQGDVFRNGQAVAKPQRLSEIEVGYIVVVFGSIHCPLCSEELNAIQQLYSRWKSQGVEVVYISLDDDKGDFRRYSTRLPFLSFSDYKQWETPSVMDYYVFGTPTMFLLDQNLTILLRPNSVRHLDSWVDWFLVQGNR